MHILVFLGRSLRSLPISSTHRDPPRLATSCMADYGQQLPEEAIFVDADSRWCFCKVKGVPQLPWHDAGRFWESHIQLVRNPPFVRISTFWDKLWKTWAFLVKKVG